MGRKGGLYRIKLSPFAAHRQRRKREEEEEEEEEEEGGGEVGLIISRCLMQA